MMSSRYNHNPYSGINNDKAALWDMLVYRDIEAFLDCDWGRHEKDFLADCFFGIHTHGSLNTDLWQLEFATLDQYKANWLGFAKSSTSKTDRENLRRSHFMASKLDSIKINGSTAICHKKFDGVVEYDSGETEQLCWKTIYLCRRVNERWKISAFIGFLPPQQAD